MPYPRYLTSFATANALGPPIFEVVEIVKALLIQEHTAIDVTLDCQVSCNWVIFIKFNQWYALLEPFTAISNIAGLLVTTDR